MTAATTESRLENLESRMNNAANTMGQLSKDFIASHDAMDVRISEQGHGVELIHNKIELLENRFGSIEQQSAIAHGRLDDLTMQLNSAPDTPDRKEIYTALAKAQQEIKNADANIENEFLNKKYADLASCLNAVRGPLSDNGIAVIQLTEDQSPTVLGIRTILAHESGQTIEDVITMSPPKLDPQGVGSCRTYMRRYSLIALCGIAGALDDDAEGTKKDPNDYPRISVGETEAIIYKADELFGERADAAVAKMLAKVFGGVAVVGDIREGEKDVAIKALENSKKLMERNEKAAAKREADAAKDAEDNK